jgi:hypothetical protein
VSTIRAGRITKSPHSAAPPPLRGRFDRNKSAEWPGYSIKWTSQEGSVIAGIVCFWLTICPFLRQKGWIGCQRGSALAGREFFPFGCFEHRIMASGTGYTSIEGTADVGGDAGSSKSPALKPKRESGANLPRNISTRMGVCRVEAVRRTSVSPRV